VIPPSHSAEFAAHMEQVITTYELPYDPAYPVINMDEQPVQLVKETRQSIEATANHGKRIDYEYERAGTAALFMFTEPLAGWRQVTARSTRTKKDWALEMANLLEGRYAECEKVTVICDNLNTHTFGAFYEAFEPERARQLACRIQFCYTPKHGSWLNVAECELSAMTRQCLKDRYISSLEQLQSEVSAWYKDVNHKQRGVEWRMTLSDARHKLKSVYPKNKT